MPKRKPGRPRKPGPRRRPVRRRRPGVVNVHNRGRRVPINQPGGQLGALLPIAKLIAPLVLGELAKPLIRKGIKKVTGRGLHPAGARPGRGLKLAGQGGGRRRRRKPGPKPGRAHILPHPLPPALMRQLLR